MNILKFLLVLFLALSTSINIALADDKNTPAINKETNENNKINPLGGCKKPKSIFFRKENSADYASIDLIFNTLPFVKHIGEKTKAIMKVNDKNTVEYRPILISVRGNYRTSLCNSVKPLRFYFVSDKVKIKIEKILSQSNIDANEPKYLEKYFELFEKVPRDEILIESPKNSLFSHLGKDLKFVSHCYTDPNYANDLLISEYYQYETLQYLGLPTESARLVKVNYLTKKNNGTAAEIFSQPQWGFFRESPPSVARRCGLSHRIPQNVKLKENKDTLSTITFMAALIGNSDYYVDGWLNGHKNGHNINYFYNSMGEVFYGPYDFDLSRLTNNPTEIRLSANDYDKFYAASPKVARVIFNNIIKRKDKILKINEQPLLSRDRQELFSEWLNRVVSQAEAALKKYK